MSLFILLAAGSYFKIKVAVTGCVCPSWRAARKAFTEFVYYPVGGYEDGTYS